MIPFLGPILSALGGEAFKTLVEKVGDWWKSEGKLLFIGWYQKRAGKKEQKAEDQAAQVKREAEEVTKINERMQEVDKQTEDRERTGNPPIYRVRDKSDRPRFE